jgi:glutamyl-tRNA reductase
MAGVDHGKADVAVREKFTFTAGEIDGAYRFFSENVQGEGNGIVLLSTCNRTELWTAGSVPATPAELLCTLKQFDVREYERYVTCLEGADAVRHLFRTANGLESLIVGENQILAQIKEAMEAAQKSACIGTVLFRLFQLSLNCAKKVKTKTNISRADRSSASAAVSFIQKHRAKGENPPVLVIGNGVVGSECARSLKAAGFDVSVTLRTHSQTAKAVPPGCVPVPYEDRYARLREHGIIISATTSPHHTVTLRELEKIWDGRERLFLDLALPRDIDEAVKKLPGLSLLNIDDFRDEDDERTPLNRAERDQIEAIISESIDSFNEWLDSRRARKTERAYFPVFMDVSRKKFLVIGGGHIALRRVRKLIPFRCEIEIRAPALCDELRKLAEDTPGAVSVTGDVYREGVCAGADFVLAVTNDRKVNHAIYEECRKNGTPVSIADRAEESDFFFPALVVEDGLVIGVTSSDNNHTKVKHAAEKIYDVFKK